MGIEAVVGLGNPGDEYEGTRHNVGFRVVDTLHRRLRGGTWERRALSLVSRARRGPAVVLAKPQTYMNRSGAAIRALCAELGIAPGSVLVVVDDVDLPLGRLRLRRRGGPGTHNGLRDVVAAVGEGFPRLRLGVRGERPTGDLAEYVLSPFSEEERETVERMVERAVEAVLAAIYEGLDAAMSRFNMAPERGGEASENSRRRLE